MTETMSTLRLGTAAKLDFSFLSPTEVFFVVLPAAHRTGRKFHSYSPPKAQVRICSKSRIWATNQPTMNWQLAKLSRSANAFNLSPGAIRIGALGFRLFGIRLPTVTPILRAFGNRLRRNTRRSQSRMAQTANTNW